MIIGTNWIVGCSHTTEAKDQYINEHVKNRKAIADIIEVFVKAGVDTFMGQIQNARRRCGTGSAAANRPEDDCRLDPWPPGETRHP